MLEKVYDHIIMDIKQNTRTDTIFIIVAMVLNFTLPFRALITQFKSMITNYSLLTSIA